jgi:hypothetical protein
LSWSENIGIQATLGGMGLATAGSARNVPTFLSAGASQQI